jgi:hypothetical protein
MQSSSFIALHSDTASEEESTLSLACNEKWFTWITDQMWYSNIMIRIINTNNIELFHSIKQSYTSKQYFLAELDDKSC